jgi:hypothetical protein
MEMPISASFAHSGSAGLDGRNTFGDNIAGGFKIPQYALIGGLGVVLLLGIAWILHRN